MRRPLLLAICLASLASVSPAGQGPAGATGACRQVIGPIDAGGNPIGFTCEDVGGSALLVWNASQTSDSFQVTSSMKTVNFFPSDFSFDGTFTSKGPLAFVGGGLGGIVINGSISAPSVVIAAVDTTETDVRHSLLAGQRLTATSSGPVIIASPGSVTATSGNAVIAAGYFWSNGSISAPNGTASITVGSSLGVGWGDVLWNDGYHLSPDQHDIVNDGGTIRANKIVLEAHRRDHVDSIYNAGTLSAKQSITFITGYPGAAAPGFQPQPETFGVANPGGQIYAAKVTITHYYPPASGITPTDRTFDTTKVSGRMALQTDVNGQVFGPTQDVTPNTTTAVLSGTLSPATSRSNLVIPQLAASLTHMNANTRSITPVIASTSTTETTRGSTSKTKPATAKPRVKAKPVLLRGAFFDSKISAKLTSNP